MADPPTQPPTTFQSSNTESLAGVSPQQGLIATPLLIKKFDFYVLNDPILHEIGLNRISPDVRFI